MKSVWIVSAVMGFAASAAYGAAFTYTDAGSWDAATGAYSAIDFDNRTIPLSPGYNFYSTAAGITVGGVQFVGIEDADRFLVEIDPAATTQTSWNFGTGKLIASTGKVTADPILRINLPSGIYSIAADLGAWRSLQGRAETVVIRLYDATFNLIALSGGPASIATSNVVTPTTANALTFFGASSDVEIARVEFQFSGAPVGTQLALDNFRYGVLEQGQEPPPGEETPEIASLLMIASGLLLIRWYKGPVLRAA